MSDVVNHVFFLNVTKLSYVSAHVNELKYKYEY